MASAPPSSLSELEEGARGTHISTLQHLLKLSHSTEKGDQQKVGVCGWVRAGQVLQRHRARPLAMPLAASVWS